MIELILAAALSAPVDRPVLSAILPRRAVVTVKVEPEQADSPVVERERKHRLRDLIQRFRDRRGK